MYRIVVLYVVFISLFTGCDLFSTREPEKPVTSSGTFLPPTSASIVIENLQNAIKEKNAENYILCLADTTKNAKRSFQFTPSSDVAARYATLFSTWGIANERQYLITMLSKISSDDYPLLTLSNNRFDVITPDSAVFVSDYTLIANHTSATAPTKVTGVIRFTIIPDATGLWAISRWSDANLAQGGVIQSTWSEMKAQFSN